MMVDICDIIRATAFSSSVLALPSTAFLQHSNVLSSLLKNAGAMESLLEDTAISFDSVSICFLKAVAASSGFS